MNESWRPWSGQPHLYDPHPVWKRSLSDLDSNRKKYAEPSSTFPVLSEPKETYSSVVLTLQLWTDNFGPMEFWKQAESLVLKLKMMKTQNYLLFLLNSSCVWWFPNWFWLYPAASKSERFKVICPQLYIRFTRKNTWTCDSVTQNLWQNP